MQTMNGEERSAPPKGDTVNTKIETPNAHKSGVLSGFVLVSQRKASFTFIQSLIQFIEKK